jgi:hypothetical protein
MPRDQNVVEVLCIKFSSKFAKGLEAMCVQMCVYVWVYIYIYIYMEVYLGR